MLHFSKKAQAKFLLNTLKESGRFIPRSLFFREGSIVHIWSNNNKRKCPKSNFKKIKTFI